MSDNARVEALLDLLARTIPVLKMATESAATNDEFRACRELYNDVADCVGGERVAQQLHATTDSLAKPTRVYRDHLREDGSVCDVSMIRWNATRVLVCIDATFVACPCCGIVLKDRFGRRGAYNSGTLWRGRIPGEPGQYQVTRTGNIYWCVEGGVWDYASPEREAMVRKHLGAFLDENA